MTKPRRGDSWPNTVSTIQSQYARPCHQWLNGSCPRELDGCKFSHVESERGENILLLNNNISSKGLWTCQIPIFQPKPFQKKRIPHPILVPAQNLQAMHRQDLKPGQ